ncbi:MAG: FAD:protein FMN transferase, partial [Phycisphaerales bacterium]
VLSDYRADSEAMRLSAASGGPPVHVSDDLFRLVLRAKEISNASDAAFDITVGPLAQLWRRARQTGTRPTLEEIDTAKLAVGARRIRLNEENQTIQLRQPKMQLDFGGIGKGFAADEALVTLAHAGITRCLVDLGGDIRVGDPPWGKSAWSIALPPRLHEGPPTIDLIQAAVATSGDTEQYVLIDGRRYSHIIDPRTGIALTNRVIVTVVAGDATTADALASAASVLGPECAMGLAIRFPGSRIWVGR